MPSTADQAGKTGTAPGPAVPPWTWARLPLIFFAARALSIVGLYTLQTPGGGTVVSLRQSFASVALLSEFATIMFLGIVYWLVLRRFPDRSRRVFRTWLAIFTLYAVFSQVDAEIRRWMGLRLNLVFINRVAAGGLEAGFWSFLFQALGNDIVGTIWSTVCGFGPLVTAALVGRPVGSSDPGAAAATRLFPGRWVLVVGLVVAGALIGVSFIIQPAVRKWRLAAPAVYGLALDTGRTLMGADVPRNPKQALADLKAEFGAPGNTDDYPLWRVVPQQERNYADFRARPLEGRPDVILVAFESLRGWFLDWQDPAIRRLVPNLDRLWHERGVVFSRAHSNGFPSGEGNMSLQLGLLSHPARAIFAEHLAIRSLSLPEILGTAGYDRVWFTASDPSYDNMQPWVDRWYDDAVVQHEDDLTLVNAVIERYDAGPRDRPRLITLYTGTTHNPFRVPASEGPPLDDPHAAYLRALTFADRALGKLFDHLRVSGRWDQTVVVVMGDHSQPNPWQLENEGDLGLVHPGRTWTGLLVAAPGMAPGVLRQDTVSQIDVPPTVLGLLGLSVSNHFMGRDLLAPVDPLRRAVALIFGGIGLYRAGIDISAYIDDLKSLQKHRYDPGSPMDPAVYQRGEDLPITDDDRAELERAIDMTREYARIVDHDRLIPPK